MSDDDRDIDIESDEEALSPSSNKNEAEKRAHHNALERKRRDHIKDSFNGLKESVPTLQGEKQASRAQILNKATEYIQFMRRKNNAHQLDIDDLKRQNDTLDKQIRALEKAKTHGNYDPSSLVDSDGTQLFTNHTGGPLSAFDNGSDSDSDSSEDSTQGRPKRLKTTTVSSNS